MSIASRLRSILNIKNQLRQSINRKGGNVSEDVPFADYSRHIDSLNVDGTANEAALKYFDFIENEVPSNFEDDTIKKLRSYLFYNAKTLKSVRCENVWKIGQYCFWECSELEEIYFPNVTEIHQYAFRSCSKLTRVHLPRVTQAGLAFRNCSYLKTIILGRLTSIQLYDFHSCYSLVNIVLPSTYVCKLPSISNDDLKYCYHFTGEVNNKYNPEGLKDGAIYVPDDLVDTYKNTDYWTNYAEFIKPLSEFKES